MNTNDPSLRSWIEIDADSHFPIQNLPFGVFTTAEHGTPHIGVAIGEWILDLAVLEQKGMFTNTFGSESAIFIQASLNSYLAMGKATWSAIRQKISRLLSEDDPTIRDNPGLKNEVLVRQAQAKMILPVAIGDYTDFYSSREHATNVGSMFRGKDNALMPNWLHLPVAYHGRSSSIVLSGTEIHRPSGQTMKEGDLQPMFGPSRLLDFELEMGFFIGPGNKMGSPIEIDRTPEHIFGFVLVNDWSARDIQKWEYQPLGPFLAKNFATSISPWVVSLEALEPFRCPGPDQEPIPLPYLQNKDKWAYDIQLEVSLQAATMDKPFAICQSNFKYLYWNICQQLAHHTITGCNMQSGDLLASGTISGPDPHSYGSLLELTWRGTKPIQLPNGEQRKFLEDGDTVTMTGWCQGEGYRVGFGHVNGTISAAI